MGACFSGGTLLLLLFAVNATAQQPSSIPSRTVSPSPPLSLSPTPSTTRFPLIGSRSAPSKSEIRNPNSTNPHGDIDIACEACHTPEGWTPLRDPMDFNHSEDTRFAMTGRHQQAECRSCHHDLRFDRPDLEPEACSSCHLDVHQGQLGNSCQDCHTTADFHLVRGLEIHAATTFPLTGTHLQISCESCHTDEFDGAFGQLDPACIACHEEDYNSTASGTVDHVAAGFPATCDACHNTLSFSSGTVFDHAAVSSGFALVGAHISLECSACHNPGDLTPLFDPADQNDCFTCHEDDYNATATTTVLDHAAANLPTDCLLCHTVDSWLGATIDHPAVSGGFALVGAHMNLDCASCHSNPDFSVPGNPSSQNDCFACHEDDHQEEHPNFPTTCLDCHGIDSWDTEAFDHSVTGFSLVGAHISLDCSSCHVGPDNTPIWIPSSQDDCFACHEDDHQDEHPEFPTTCLDCHTTDSWENASFDHGAATGFPLLGAHMPLDCSSCHLQPGFELLWEPSSADDCLTCHEEDHQDAHPNFPTTCLECHATDSWESESFDHGATTGFALLGAHLPLDCSSCHLLPGFELIWEPSGPNDCVTCHQEDAAQAHAGFPPTCLDCHTVDSWASTFDHDPIFPIYSGRHEGEWASCQTCHTDPGNFMVFTCLTCHEHNQEEMDDKHEDVQGYVYESNACYSCHPDGEEKFGRAR